MFFFILFCSSLLKFLIAKHPLFLHFLAIRPAPFTHSCSYNSVAIMTIRIISFNYVSPYVAFEIIRQLAGKKQWRVIVPPSRVSCLFLSVWVALSLSWVPCVESNRQTEKKILSLRKENTSSEANFSQDETGSMIWWFGEEMKWW